MNSSGRWRSLISSHIWTEYGRDADMGAFLEEEKPLGQRLYKEDGLNESWIEEAGWLLLTDRPSEGEGVRYDCKLRVEVHVFMRCCWKYTGNGWEELQLSSVGNHLPTQVKCKLGNGNYASGKLLLSVWIVIPATRISRLLGELYEVVF